MKAYTMVVLILSVMIGAMVILSTDCSAPSAVGAGGDGSGSGGNGTGGGGTGTGGGGTGSGGGSGGGGTGSGGDGTTQQKVPTAVLYTGEAIGGGIGPAIRDAILANDAAVATVSSLEASKSYSYTLGDQSGTITTDAQGQLVITKGQLANTNAADGAKLVINKEGGDSTTETVVAVYHPKQIFTWQDLQAMRVDAAGSYTVMKDIVFPALNSLGFPATGFEPIARFTGTLDGKGKTITGFAIDDSAKSGVGVFDVLAGSAKATVVVNNLTFHNASLAGHQRVGVIAGELKAGTLSNVAVTVDESQKATKKITGGTHVGGLVGLSGSDGVVQGQSHINVESNDQYVGGLVGYSSGAVTGYSTGNVSGTGSIGGTVGYTEGVVIGYATGNVSGTSSNIGGLVGYSNNATINGYALGTVSGGSVVGGLAGTSNVLNGYSRGLLERKTNTGSNYGYVLSVGTIGDGGVYYSNRRGRFSFVSADGAPFSPTNAVGTGLTVDASTNKSAFGSLTFGTVLGQWTWVKDGNWPAINLGLNVGQGSAAADQPTAAHTAATVISAPTFNSSIVPTAASIPLAWSALSTANAKAANGAPIDLARDVAIEIYYLMSADDTKDAAAIIAGNNKLAFLNGEVRSATLAGLTAGTKYHVLLRVVNKTDVSKTDDLIQAFTTAAP